MLLDLLTAVARQGRLRVSPPEAARQIVAANVGVTLSLIAQPVGDVDTAMSRQVRDAVVGSLITGEPAAGEPAVGTLAVALSATLGDDVTALSPGEQIMLREWLSRLSA
jgi:hypothetical protein